MLSSRFENSGWFWFGLVWELPSVEGQTCHVQFSTVNKIHRQILSTCPFAVRLPDICLISIFLGLSYGGFPHKMSVCRCMTFTVSIFVISNSLYVVEIEFSMIYQIFWEKNTLWKKFAKPLKKFAQARKGPPKFRVMFRKFLPDTPSCNTEYFSFSFYDFS